MALIAWNIRGMNKDSKIREIKLLLVANRIEIFSLIETIIKSSMQIEVKEKMGNKWRIITNSSEMAIEHGDSIWLGWDPLISMGDISSITQQHVHGSYLNLGGVRIHVTVVYGKNKKEEWEELWRELAVIRNLIGIDPWIIMVDLNATRYLDNWEGQGAFDFNEAKKFNDTLVDIEVEELGSSGGHYT